MEAANNISFTFNWFYADDEHIAYFNSGANPVRPSNVDPNLPTFGRSQFLWQNFDPDTDTADITPLAAHPQVIDQNYLTSWNNRQAPGYNTGYSSLYRSQPLDDRIKPDIAGANKVNLQELISDMEDAGTVDLRGDRVLPWILKVIDTQPVASTPLRRRAPEAQGLGRRRRSPHRPKPGRGLRARAGDPDPGRLVAAPARGGVQADARRGAVQSDQVSPRRPGPAWLRLQRELVRLRPQGPP